MTDTYNPWAGLASYEDPKTARQKLKFCGRDDDSYDLARLIMGNVFVTLYGKSGIGKTSLLNAGVFPELRQEQYSPDSLRLGIRDEEHPQSYQAMIIEAAERIATKTNTINVIAEQKDPQAIDYLWNYFARHRFYDKNDEPTTPVFVFDQFEEVFRGHRDEAEILLKQLDYLNDKDHALDRCEIDGQTYRYEQNYRFVVSIREDDLYLLEDSIDNCYLPALKRCRYRLRSLTEEGARDAILIPGKGLFNDNDKQPITDAIISKSRNDDGSISTNIISLLCSRIYVDFKKSGENHISPLLVDNFLKGNPFEKFYNEATRGFSDREKSYIEDNFVDSTGRRNSIPESNFLKHVPNGAALLEGDKRILQRTSTSSDGKNNRVELIHDSFCDPLSKQKEKREKKKRLLQLGLACLVTILSVAAIIYVWSINRQIRVNESKFIAEKASALADQGDYYLARLLALQALPPNRPYTAEAECALRKALQKNNTILRGHTDDVNYASFSPDGRYIVSASTWDNTIRIWDAETKLQVKCLQTNTDYGFALSAAFSPDGKYIASASSDSTIRIWNVHTELQEEKTLKLPNDVQNASLSPDGKYIVVIPPLNSTASIFDVNTGMKVGSTLVGHTNEIESATFSPDGRYIVTASIDSTIRIWDAKTGQQAGKTLDGHTSAVYSASFSPDGKYIVAVLVDNTIRIWDVTTSKQVWKALQANPVMTASFSPDGKYIVSGYADGMVRIWEVETGELYDELEGHTGCVKSASFSPDGRYIVSASYDNTVRIWDTEKEQPMERILDLKTYFCYSASIRPDGKYIAASLANIIKIWDAKTGQLVKNLKGHTEDVYSVAFSPDGRYIVSTSLDTTVRIWEAKTGKQVGSLKGNTEDIETASFSPDGKYIVSASEDETVRIWDAKTGQQVGEPLSGHTRRVNSASFSPDGRYIVSASDDNTVRIWNAKTGLQVGEPLVGHTNDVETASFSPDGKYIVSASYNTIRIWDAKSGQQLGSPFGSNIGCRSASFSPDGKYIVAVGSSSVFIWMFDAQIGQPIGDPVACTDEGYESAVFSSDGRYIATLSTDKSNYERAITIWKFLSIEELIDSTTEQFKNRPLTPEERKKYYLE